jgi:hypothetical protein
MADIKFSQFTPQTGYTSLLAIVGYNGSSNVRITPDDFMTSWNGRQSTLRFQNNIVGTTSFLEVGAASHTSTELNLATSATASYQINSLNAITYDGTDWNLANGFITTSGSDVTIASRVLTIGDGISSMQIDLATTPALSGTITGGGSQILVQSPGSDLLIGPNDDILIDDTGSPLIALNSPIAPTIGIVDITTSQGSAGYVLASNGAGLGVSWEQKNPACQVKISGVTGLANTNNGADFLVPYNTVTVNDDATIFNPVVTGGFGNQGAIQVLKAGRYAFQARYSSFDLVQPSLPTVDGSKFFRITASTDTVAAGIGTKQCVLQDLIVATSGNGEAVVTGSGYMDLNANDYFKIIGFHTGATGGSGTQGFPVNNNALFNEPQLWLVKVQ